MPKGLDSKLVQAYARSPDHYAILMQNVGISFMAMLVIVFCTSHALEGGILLCLDQHI